MKRKRTNSEWVMFEMGMVRAFEHMEMVARSCATAHKMELARLKKLCKGKRT